MNIRTFCVWVWKSIYQGTAILMLGLFMFRDSFANIVMITFTSLILIEILNVCTQIHRFTFPMVLM